MHSKARLARVSLRLARGPRPACRAARVVPGLGAMLGDHKNIIFFQWIQTWVPRGSEDTFRVFDKRQSLRRNGPHKPSGIGGSSRFGAAFLGLMPSPATSTGLGPTLFMSARDESADATKTQTRLSRWSVVDSPHFRSLFQEHIIMKQRSVCANLTKNAPNPITS